MAFKYFTDEDGDLVVIDKHILPSGMTVEIQFDLYNLNNVSVANVFLNVYKKRKQISENRLHQTGKDGLKPFFWALKKINEFDEYCRQEFESNLPMYIQVCWDDNRRARIYKRYLPRYGFQLRDFGEGMKLYREIWVP